MKIDVRIICKNCNREAPTDWRRYCIKCGSDDAIAKRYAKQFADKLRLEHKERE